MLEMDERRLDYLEQLRPEDGYELNSAIATTYSLDFGALLGACLSLANQDFGGDPALANKVGLFASVERMRGKLAVFCEKGRIKNDQRGNELCVLMEGLVHQVVVRKPKNASTSIASFHPKVWVLDYVNKEDKSHSYRLIVLSRNLTFGGAWDIAVRLDGVDTGELASDTGGVISFLEYLRTTLQSGCDRSLKQRIRKLQNALKTVRFEIDSSLYDECEFVPFGPKESKLVDASRYRLFTENHTNALIVSPFLGLSGPLERFAEQRTKRGMGEGEFILISREESLRKLNEEIARRFRICAPKAWLADVDIEAECKEGDAEESLGAVYSDLHAKIYVTENDRGRNIYVGSFNASRNAMYGNVEVLFRLHYKKRMGLFKEIVDGLLGDGRPFGDLKGDFTFDCEEAYSQDDLLDRYFRSAAKLYEIKNVFVEKRGDAYQLTVEGEMELYDGIEENIRLYLAPYLAQNQRKPLGGRVSFVGLTESQVSAFFVLSCKGDNGFRGECLLCCPGALFHDGELDSFARIKSVLGRILAADEQALSAYVSLAFGIESISCIPNSLSGGIGKGGSLGGSSLAPGLYEQLLKGLSVSADAQRDLGHARAMLDFLPEQYIDTQIDSLRSLIDMFEKAVNRRGKR